MNASVPAQVFASHLLAQLVANGIDHVFVAPGARSQALAIAAGQLAQAGHVELHVVLDERSLAFQALGVGLSSGFPAAVITTSGTAVANLHPAVLEAHHAGVPMILLTADRPLELRGVGANQTTNQVGIFADAVRDCVDVPAPAAGDTDAVLIARAAELAETALTVAVSKTGPVQLNLGFREPLSSIAPNAAAVFDALALAQLAEPTQTGAINLVSQNLLQTGSLAQNSLTLESSSTSCGQDCTCGGSSHDDTGLPQPETVINLALKTVVVAGDGGDLARWYCTGLPLFAEPSSGVRHLPESVPGYLFALTNRPDLVDQIEQVLVFGKPTLSRQVQAILRKPGIKVLVDPGRHGIFNPAHNATVLGNDVEFIGDPEPTWLADWKLAAESEAAKTTTAAETENSDDAKSLGRRQLIHTVWSSAGKRNPLVLGASSLIRVADYWAPPLERIVFANRGLAGIDGTIATATGIAYTHLGGIVRVLLGDLTFLHDAGSLAIDAESGVLNLQVIVGNDHGGAIFSGLEVAKTISDSQFSRLFKTPQSASLELLAKAYGWNYVLATNASQLKLAMKLKGRVVIEVPVESA